jgi:hypothetical protein
MPEKILLVCTSNEANVKKALQVVLELFREPQVDLLCTRAELNSYEGLASARRVFVFPSRTARAGALKQVRRLRSEKYDVVGVLWCLDPGRTAAKVLSFFYGGKRLLVFNENLDCDYLSPAFLHRLFRSRLHNGTLIRGGAGAWLFSPLKMGYWRILRVVLFPLRLVGLFAAVGMLYLSSAFREKRP